MPYDTDMMPAADTPVQSGDSAVKFSALDRCDRCGAQACHRVTMPSSESELLFCNHHYQKHQDALFEQGARVESALEHLDS